MKFYYFLYYSFYKFWDYFSSPKMLSDFKSVITIGFIKILIFLSFLYYTDTVLSKIQLIIIALLFIIIPNIYL
ncbi:membrane-bound ClpP family serine protease [Chryseobacterium sp. W4I1]|nr:membrane-bound ClpP family serine protease [Chryseobacterium sp. W4I1]